MICLDRAFLKRFIQWLQVKSEIKENSDINSLNRTGLSYDIDFKI